jgi:hypothetical protein
MIEIAPRSEALMTYDEAVFYCKFLKHDGHIDWRMPTFHEYTQHDIINGWCEDRVEGDHMWWVYPVRDIC